MPPPHPLEEHIRSGREERNREYKSAFDWSSNAGMRASVIRAVLAMANHPDGGVVVVGMRPDPTIGTDAHAPDGVPAEWLPAFCQDTVQGAVNAFADPYADITVTHVQVDDRTFVVIQVRAFDDVPVVCRRNSCQPTLEEGRIYCRPRRIIASVPVPSQAEMREILDRAVELRLAPEVARVRSVCPVGGAAADLTSERAFADERGPF